MTVRTDRIEATDFYLRTTAVIFAAAVLVHGSDHVRRGLGASPTAVMIAGSIQAVVVLIAVVLVFRRTRWAPHAAIVAGRLVGGRIGTDVGLGSHALILPHAVRELRPHRTRCR